ncbi:metal-sulfur cluster assembly factor [Rhizobium mongolense]|uniref:Metal-sulfur cluster biosynthetic enzyme n=1 Tax=Rhizobium mongolense TaxID=57676 RepID=A0A7W6RVA0_9HYPH|nr:metal-sulfur cluster assembly factor [Rhizobium mongolense]MBB4279251.1 metal-sulfur cluster biosynthetic enzyme [Rhizobium mongolense]
MTTPQPISASAVLLALRAIQDPEVGTDIVELGLIYLVEIKPDAAIRIVMTTTTRACPASAFIAQAVRERLNAIPGIGQITVDLVYEPPWSPDMIGKLVA